MNKSLLFFFISINIFSLSAQNNNSGALLNLGFNAKLLNLNSDSQQIHKVNNEQVRKSPRSLSDILNKVPKSSELKSADPKSSELKSSELKVQYYLVAGCFWESQNATNLASSLKIEGYNSSIIKDDANLFIVTYDNYNSYKEAISVLHKLKQKGIDCWVKRTSNN